MAGDINFEIAKLVPQDGDLIVVTVQETGYSQNDVDYLARMLRNRISKNITVVVMTHQMTIQDYDEGEMLKLGWVRGGDTGFDVVKCKLCLDNKIVHRSIPS